MKKYYPHLTLIFLVFVTVDLWIFSKPPEALQNTSPLILVSQVLALLGFVFMSVSFLMATRVKVLESFFGGLDRLYKNHKHIGGLAFSFSILHPILLYINSLPDLNLAQNYLFISPSIPYSLGVLSVYILITSFIFMVFIRLPYNLWKVSHRSLGISFLIGGMHAFTIGSDVANSLALQIFVYSIFILGMFSFLYIVFLYKKFSPRHEFTVTGKERVGDILNLQLSVGKSFNFQPGQFVYLTFRSGGIPKELHPFSLSSAPFENSLRISAKVVGDFTLKLSEIKAGDNGVLYGPYGSFSEVADRKAEEESIWVAGGIGITPFLSMLRNEFIKKEGKKVHFFYCCKDREEAVFHNEISEIQKIMTNVNYCLWCSSERNRITAGDIVREVTNIKDAAVRICGPRKMMDSLSSQLIKVGVPEGNIRYEQFDLL